MTSTPTQPFPTTLESRYKPMGAPLQGGMGIVFPCTDRFTEKKVAVKIFSAQPKTPEARKGLIERFNHEVTVLQGISHPNVVQVFEHAYISVDGQMVPFYSMEWLEGLTLLDILRHHKELLDFGVVNYIMSGLLSGLYAIHRARIVHCDLKPQNVMITTEGTVKIIDFGIAVDLRPSKQRRPDTKFTGTPAYASPEHFEPQRLEPRSDLFCAGWILYSLLTRVPPPTSGKGSAASMGMIMSGEFGLTDLDSFVHLGAAGRFLQPILGKFLAFEVDRRFPDCHIAGRELSRALDSLDQRSSAHNLPRFLSTIRGRRAVAQNIFSILSGKASKRRPIDMEWVNFPRAIGKIGCPWGRENEQPVREVDLSRFAIGRYCVTAAQFLEFVRDQGGTAEFFQAGDVSVLKVRRGKVVCPAGSENLPMNCVNYHGAKAYCAWLSKRLGHSVTLPSEAQWEAAASWDLEKGLKYQYPWGMQPLSSRAHVQRRWMTADQTLAPVDAYADGMSPIGCYQMIGNVWEWCLDGYVEDGWDGLPMADPVRRAAPEGNRVIRGGDFNCNILDLRVSLRASAPEWARLKYLGFRVAVNFEG